MSTFREKYLKYKKKYLALKNQLGGVVCPNCKKEVGDLERCPECYRDLRKDKPKPKQVKSTRVPGLIYPIIHMMSGQEAEIPINPLERVSDLKVLIAENPLLGNPSINLQKLVLMPESEPYIVLENHRTLKHYKIKNGTVIELVVVFVESADNSLKVKVLMEMAYPSVHMRHDILDLMKIDLKAHKGELNLSRCKYLKMELLSEALKGIETITDLNLSDNRSFNVNLYENCEFLKRLLSQNKSITKLNLSHIYLDSICMEMLSETLAQNNSITNLNLSENIITRIGEHEISDRGMRALANILTNNRTITNLDIGRIILDSSESNLMGILFEALSQNNSITHLSLRYNQINDNNVIHLAQVLRHNTTITSIDLYGNRIGDDGAIKLAELLRENRTITKIELLLNNYGSVGTNALEAVQAERPELSVM